MTVISAPVDSVEFVSNLRLPTKADCRLQRLMDRNTEGELTEEEPRTWNHWWNSARLCRWHGLKPFIYWDGNQSDVSEHISVGSATPPGNGVSIAYLSGRGKGREFHVEHILPRVARRGVEPR